MVSKVVSDAFRYCECSDRSDPLDDKGYRCAYNLLVIEYSRDLVEWFGGDIETYLRYKDFFASMINSLRFEDKQFNGTEYERTLNAIVNVERAVALNLPMRRATNLYDKNIEALELLTDKKTVDGHGQRKSITFRNTSTPIVLKSYFLSTFKNLRKLSLISCRLEHVPEGVVVLRKLQTLDLTGNGIKGLPMILNTMATLKTIKMIDNPIVCRPKHLRGDIKLELSDRKRKTEGEHETDGEIKKARHGKDVESARSLHCDEKSIDP